MRRVLRHRVRQVAIVTLKTGVAFRGVLYDHDDQALALRNVEALTPGGVPTVVDGELLVLLADVLFLQIAG